MLGPADLIAGAGPVGVLELRGRNESDFAVQAAVVKLVDVFADGAPASVTDYQPRAGRIAGLRMNSALNSELSPLPWRCR